MDSNLSKLGPVLTALMFLGAGLWYIIRAKEIQRGEIARYESTPKNWIERLSKSWPPETGWAKSPHYVLYTRLMGAFLVAVGAALLLLVLVGRSG